VVASGALEPGDVPGVLDLPVTRGQGKTSDQRRAVFAGRAGKRLSGLGHDSEAGDPVSMLAAAGEGPAPANPLASSCRLGRSAGCGGAGHDCVRTIAVDLPVDFRLQHGGKDAAAASDAHGPSNGAIDSAERGDNLERFRKLELKAAIAARHEEAKHADRPQRFHQIDRDTPSGFNLRDAGGDFGSEGLDIGEQTLGCGGHRRDIQTSGFAQKTACSFNT
jgi:hypothetical protein